MPSATPAMCCLPAQPCPAAQLASLPSPAAHTNCSWYECVHDAPEMRRLLGLDGGDKCLGFFVVGRSDRAGAYRASRPKPSAEWR